MALLNIKEISKSYNNQDLFQALSFEINRGDKLVITGSSGCGKTTLMNMLIGFVFHDRGIIQFENNVLDSTNIHLFRSHCSWLPQEVSFDVETARDFVMLPFSFKINRDRIPTENNIRDIMNNLMLPYSLLDSTMLKVSGGEKQRLALLSILLMKKGIVFLDEPTSALDQKAAKAVIDLFLKDKDCTVISVSHHELWQSKCNRIIAI